MKAAFKFYPEKRNKGGVLKIGGLHVLPKPGMLIPEAAEVSAWLPSLSPFAVTSTPCPEAPEPSGLKPLITKHLCIYEIRPRQGMNSKREVHFQNLFLPPTMRSAVVQLSQPEHPLLTIHQRLK